MSALEEISILIVEDDPLAREQLMDTLSYETREVWEAKDGEEGLNLFREKRPDIVLTDIQMPHMDGTELCRHIREENPDCPTVIMTAHHDESYLLKAIRSGVREYVFKPIDTYDLVKRLNAIAQSLLYQNEIKKREIMTRALLDSQKGLVLLSDGKKPFGCNQAFLKFVGFADLESFAAQYHCVCALFLDRGKEYLLPSKSPDDTGWIEQLKSDPTCRAKAVMMDKTGREEHIFLVEATPIDFEDEQESFVVSFSDITEQERLLLAQSKQAAMGEMISAIAHQIKQPLNVINMLPENLLDQYETEGVDGETIEEFTRQIQQQVAFMSQTINRLRDFLKPSSENRIFDLMSAIQEVLDIIAPILEKSGIIVQFQHPGIDHLERKTFGNAEEFHQVLLNLLINARDAMESLKVRNREIMIRLASSADSYVLEIEDNGGGIPEEVLPHLFESHFTTKKEGTGIGLSLARQVVQKMGGTIKVENRNEGACFTISLPN